MRLKFLFFPIILVISVFIFIGYIWPEIDNVKTANQEKVAANQLLKDVKDKQTAIGSVGQQIIDNGEGATIVGNYLPDKKVEERIIGGVNYLAMDAGVSLVNISLTDVKIDDATWQDQQNTVNAISAATSSVKMLANAEIPAVDPATGQVASGNGNRMRFSEAAISITGEYRKIGLFLDQLQKMPLLSHIKSLTISNQINDSKSADSGSAISTDLAAGIVVDFGYLLKSSGAGNVSIAEFKSELDNGTIKTLKDYISQKAAWISSTSGYTSDKGKENPFLP